MSMTKEEAIHLLASKEWLTEGIWCAFCDANRVGWENQPIEEHTSECVWAVIASKKLIA